jgi:hypothetical protein
MRLNLSLEPKLLNTELPCSYSFVLPTILPCLLAFCTAANFCWSPDPNMSFLCIRHFSGCLLPTKVLDVIFKAFQFASPNASYGHFGHQPNDTCYSQSWWHSPGLSAFVHSTFSTWNLHLVNDHQHHQWLQQKQPLASTYSVLTLFQLCDQLYLLG